MENHRYWTEITSESDQSDSEPESGESYNADKGKANRVLNEQIDQDKANKPPRLRKQQNTNADNKGSGLKLLEFLQTNGGKLGTWDNADHTMFVQMYESCNGCPDMVLENLRPKLKRKSATEIMTHIKWYEDLMSLKRSSHSALQVWREKKKQEKVMIDEMFEVRRRREEDYERQRKERLKNLRLEQCQKARVKANIWREQKSKSAGPILRHPRLSRGDIIDPNCFRKEMLGLIDSIKTFELGHGKDERLLEMGVGKLQMTKLKPPPPLPPQIRSKASVVHASTSTDTDVAESKISLVEENVVKNALTLPRLMKETLTHRVKKEAQTIKCLEIRSLKGHIPHRIDELQMGSFPSSLQLLRSKRAVPAWRKIQ